MKVSTFVLLSRVSVAAFLLASATATAQPAAWNSSMYSYYNAETFSKSPYAALIIEPADIDFALLNAAIFYETNRHRVAKKIKPLQHSATLEYIAADHSSDMYKLNFFEHTSPVNSKRDMCDRYARVGGKCEYFGENICNSTARGTYVACARMIVDSWMESDGHRKNILNPKYLYMGIGTHGTANSLYATQDFSSNDVPLRADLPAVYRPQVPKPAPTAENNTPLKNKIPTPVTTTTTATAQPMQSNGGSLVSANSSAGQYFVILGTYTTRESAEKALLEAKGYKLSPVALLPNGANFRVVVGPFTSRQEADAYKPNCTKYYAQAWILAVPRR